MVLYTVTVIVWFTVLFVLLVLIYFYWRDRKARKTKGEEKVKPAEEAKDSGRSYAIVIKDDGSLRLVFKEGEVGERLPDVRTAVSASYKGAGKEGVISKRRRTRVFADRGRMIKFLGGTITCDLSEMIPEEKGTYALILYVWKNELTPVDASLGASYKVCKSCGTQNDADALYCKKCGGKL